MPRTFNTTGPCSVELHYMIEPESRLPRARELLEEGLYFVLHAPRQTGKTTLLRELARRLTEEGELAAVYVSLEMAEPLGDDVDAVEDVCLHALSLSARWDLPEALRPPPWEVAPRGSRVLHNLGLWARACQRPLVLLIDEIDAIRGTSLISVLRQLRAGFSRRPRDFPHALVLCGLRDVRDYKAASGGDPQRLGTSSPFNIKVESLKLGVFREEETQALYAQHTAETGQRFSEQALDSLVELSGGQPWLVNSLGREIVRNMGVPVEETIEAHHVEDAKEQLILERQTHLDSLVARLMEPRVRRIIEPLIAGDAEIQGETYDDDVSYVRDLGLVTGRPLEVANPIYREVIVRARSEGPQDVLSLDPRTFVAADGRLDVRVILEEFAAFWRQHGELLENAAGYREVAPQLVLMAWLQRIVNGGGFIDREYGVGRGRVDLLVRWPIVAADGSRTVQREAFELKVWREGRPDPLAKGLVQLDAYLERLGLDRGVLVLFDRREGALPWEERTCFEEASTGSGRAVTVLRA